MKLSLEALKSKATQVASEELMKSINGGLENGCHIKNKIRQEGHIQEVIIR
jgi:hypothetical protein